MKFWQSAKNWQVFGTGGGTYFALLADRFITYKNKIGSSATPAYLICTPGWREAL